MSEELSFEDLSKALDIPRHVIHLWTKKFPILNPQRMINGKVGFKNRDILIAKGLKKLLLNDQKTIKEVQTLLNERGVSYVIDLGKNDKTIINTPGSATSFNKPEKNIVFSPKQAAKQAFNNLNDIFSKEKKRSITTSPEEELMLQEVTTPTEASAEETQEVGNFEDDWRHHMEQAGRATPVEEARDKPNLIDNSLLNDIWEIDDEVELFTDEPEDITPQVETAHNIKARTADFTPQQPLNSPNMQTSSLKNHSGETLSIDQIEKLKHLISKLDIMHDEIQHSNGVIHETLKAFGYSGFENAYSKFD